MIRSYALVFAGIRWYSLVFAAVTLRIELPNLAVVFQDFDPAYAVVSWLCWVPNLLVAEWYVRWCRAVVTPDLPRHWKVAASPQL
jgi:hypothetical protein